MEGHPEEDDHEEDEAEGDEALARLFAGELDDLGFEGRGLGLLALGQGGRLVVFAEGPEDDHREDEADAGHAEAEVVGLAQGIDVVRREAAQRVDGHGRVLALGDGQERGRVGQLALEEIIGQGRYAGVIDEVRLAQDPVAHGHGGRRGEHGPDVDAHVEDVERPVAHPRVLGVVVEVADEGLEVALEQARAQGHDGQRGDDEREPGVHRRRQGQQDVADEHDDDAQADRPAVAEEAVGQEAAEQGEDVDADQEGGVDRARGGGGKSVLRLHEQDEDADHGVEAEAFAHVGEEGDEQAFRVSFEHGSPSSGEIREKRGGRQSPGIVTKRKGPGLRKRRRGQTYLSLLSCAEPAEPAKTAEKSNER